MIRYSLVGVINLFDVFPDFVLPVFEMDNKLFVQEGEKGIGTGMLRLDEIFAQKVLYFDTSDDLSRRNNRFSSIPYSYKKIRASMPFNPIFCFQSGVAEYILGTKDDLNEFFKNYENDSKRVMDEINNFIEDNPVSKDSKYSDRHGINETFVNNHKEYFDNLVYKWYGYHISAHKYSERTNVLIIMRKGIRKSSSRKGLSRRYDDDRYIVTRCAKPGHSLKTRRNNDGQKSANK